MRLRESRKRLTFALLELLLDPYGQTIVYFSNKTQVFLKRISTHGTYSGLVGSPRLGKRQDIASGDKK